MRQITIRPALTSEADALSRLCFRSKAHWGYDADFMAKSRASLTVAPDLIASGSVLVLEVVPAVCELVLFVAAEG